MDKYYLKDNNLQIISSIISETFDNDDNPYIKFRANLETPEGWAELPMVKCDRPDFISETIQKKYYYG